MMTILVICAIILIAALMIGLVVVIIIKSKRKNKPSDPRHGTQARNKDQAAKTQYKPAPPQITVDEYDDDIITGDDRPENESSIPLGFTIVRKKTNESILIKKPEFIIGKEKRRADYCVADNSSVSRAHAKLNFRAGRVYITDLGSTNCTYVNGVKISPYQRVLLSKGDRIKISNEEFDFLG